MLRWCVVTTPADFSLNHFLERDGRVVDIYLYGEIDFTTLQSYDVIYFRDPFNNGTYDLDTIKKDTATLLARSPNAYVIDHVDQFDDLLIEDKWIQYQFLKPYMPDSKLAASRSVPKSQLAKRRISSRGKGIYFEGSTLTGSLDDYIFQARLKIKTEYRCYVIGGHPLPLIAVRSSKTPHSRVKTEKLIRIPDSIRRFIEIVHTSGPPFDFVGYDVAVTETGLYLLEANRSPQFNLYNRLGHENLADILMHSIERKIESRSIDLF